MSLHSKSFSHADPPRGRGGNRRGNGRLLNGGSRSAGRGQRHDQDPLNPSGYRVHPRDESPESHPAVVSTKSSRQSGQKRGRDNKQPARSHRREYPAKSSAYTAHTSQTRALTRISHKGHGSQDGGRILRGGGITKFVPDSSASCDATKLRPVRRDAQASHTHPGVSNTKTNLSGTTRLLARKREIQRPPVSHRYTLLHGKPVVPGSEADDEDDESEGGAMAHASARSYSDDLEDPRKSMAMTTTATPAIVSSDSDFSDANAHPGRHDAHHDEESLIPHLAAAFRKLDLATNVSIYSRRKLPFLRRVLQKGFHGFCEQQGISTTREPPHLPVEVQYRIEVQQTPPSPGSDSDSDEENERNISSGPVIEARHSTMSSWRCPLCSHLGELHSRDMLMFHLTRDHPNTQTSWEQCGQTEPTAWRLIVTLDISSSASQHSDTSTDESHSDVEEFPENLVPEYLSTDLHDETGHFREPDNHTALVPGASDERPHSQVIQSTADIPAAMSDAAEPATQGQGMPTPAAKIEHKFLRRSPSPPYIESARTKPPRVATSHTSYRGSLPPQYPDPPPPSDSLGPAAQYPYLPEEEYSCRPGGPRLFDLLNTLSLEPYGVLSWMIVDREEEIYEIEDVRDEDKVVMALWNRWIFLNRRKFVFEGYLNGATAFIEEYWLMIHRAAGWSALRTFLLMMMANKYLSPNDVASLLKQYESKTGMELWYKD